MKSFFEATYSGAEVTKFDVYFGLFNIDFWNAFVVKQNFVELNQGLFKIVLFQCLLSFSKSFENLLFSNS